MIRTPFFRSYSAEIEHIGFRTFYSQISIESMRKFTKPEEMSFVLLAGTLQDEEKEDVWVALFAK
jgi:hypothetical protein